MTEDARELAAVIAKRFIQRKDVKAVQRSGGIYRPDRTPWKFGDLVAHVEGKSTFGHYICDRESLTKLFVFDIDLEKKGTWVERPNLADLPDGPMADELLAASSKVHESEPRTDWRDRKHPGRQWYKGQLRLAVELLSSAIHTELGIDTASTYSGNKGCHVYGFLPEPVPAVEARMAAHIALERAGKILDPNHSFQPTRGANFFQYTDPDPVTGLMNLSIEVFPKADSMEDKDLGNLCRLPLGVNLKGPTWKSQSGKTIHEPTFFIDQRQAHDTLNPHPNPLGLLQDGNPWKS